MGRIRTVLIVLTTIVVIIDSRAHHHKVHNLALYPERHSWCQVENIRQEISFHSDPECHPITIDNKVCIGACFSYSVPRSEDDPIIPPYCDACRPTETTWTVVMLNCTKEETGEIYKVARNVEIISNCSCIDCNSKKSSSSDEAEETLGHSQNHHYQYRHQSKVGEIISAAAAGKAKETEEFDEEDNGSSDEEDEMPVIGRHPGIHNIKSVSAEHHHRHQKLNDNEVERMIQDNKISPDDD